VTTPAIFDSEGNRLALGDRVRRPFAGYDYLPGEVLGFGRDTVIAQWLPHHPTSFPVVRTGFFRRTRVCDDLTLIPTTEEKP
jgi:hypothetical protein